ncbi:MAG: hypothetical protein VCC04_07165 [Myxococcota bacterium]
MPAPRIVSPPDAGRPRWAFLELDVEALEEALLKQEIERIGKRSPPRTVASNSGRAES